LEAVKFFNHIIVSIGQAVNFFLLENTILKIFSHSNYGLFGISK